MTAVQILSIWLASLVFTIFPPTRIHPNNTDKQEAYKTHVEEVVQDIQEIIYDPNYKPWFTGKWARAQDAALTTIIAAEESGGFNLEVEAGRVRGDSGSSWCLMAINIGKGKTADGWTGPDLVSDRKKCLTAGINIMKKSMNACRSSGILSALSAYNTGRCIKNERISVSRMSRVVSIVHKNIPTDDMLVIRSVPINEDNNGLLVRRFPEEEWGY